MQGVPPLASPRLSRRRHGLNLRCRCPLGGLPGWSPADVAVPESVGVACLFSRLPTLPLVLFLAPIPPPPFPAGRGRSKVYFAGGFAPGTPALDRPRHLQTFPNRSPAQRGARGLPPEWQEMLSFGQCRQPRRGGTGGDGTIRRTRRRRLRWFSPPGHGEQVPPGAPPLASPRRSRKRHGLNLRCRCPLGGLPGWSPADVAVPESVGVACLSSRPPTLAFSLLSCPIPPTPFPSGEGGDF